MEHSTPLRLASRMILPRFERRVFLSLLLLPFDSAAKTLAVICPGSVRVRTVFVRDGEEVSFIV